MFVFAKSAEKAIKQQANQLYGKAVASARDPRFYRDLGVEDTPDGRLALVSLHVYLLLSRLKGENTSGMVGCSRAGASEAGSRVGPDETFKALSQHVMDIFVADLDQAMREIGIGDMGVGRRVKKAVTQFFDLSQRLNAAHTADAQENAVKQVLLKFVPGLTSHESSADRLVAYVKRAECCLQSLSNDALTEATSLFPTPNDI